MCIKSKGGGGTGEVPDPSEMPDLDSPLKSPTCNQPHVGRHELDFEFSDS